jgi:hexosaminidase
VEAVKHGRQAIMSPTSHAYFDYDLKSIDLKKVYSFYPVPEGISPSEAELILGGECNMWTERVPDEATLDSKVFPRLLAMSEVLWSDSTGKDFTEFQNRVEAMYLILDQYEVNYGREAVPFTYEVTLEIESASVKLIPYSGRIRLKYRKDCPECDTLSSPYVKPIKIDGDFELIVESMKGEKAYGDPISIPFEAHRAVNARVSYQSEFSEWYTAGGEKALVDSKLGTLDFRDGSWQGFWGNDFSCVVDLGEDKPIREVSANFYQYNNSCIFMPEIMEVLVSNAGDASTPLSIVLPKTTPQQRGKQIENLSIMRENPINARYIKLKAKNIGKVPDWHEAAGSDAWIVIDEIIVE